MKTLEQAAQQRANKFSEVIVEGTEIPCLIEDLNLWAKEDFKKGFSNGLGVIECAPKSKAAEEIKKLLNTIPNSKTILVKRPNNDYCKNNAADLNVDNFKYNIVINNNSNLEHLKELAYNFCIEEKLIS